jgi:hypothetical protein
LAEGAEQELNRQLRIKAAHLAGRRHSREDERIWNPSLCRATGDRRRIIANMLL